MAFEFDGRKCFARFRDVFLLQKSKIECYLKCLIELSIDELKFKLGHGVHGSTVYAGIDTKSGELVAISEWVLKWRHVARGSKKDKDEEGEKYMKQVI